MPTPSDEEVVMVTEPGVRFRWWAAPLLWLAASLSGLVFRYGREVRSYE